MKIMLFGATGATGHLLVEGALAAGHTVTAYVRDPSRLSVSGDGVRVIVGDVLDPEAVMAAIAGHDAVISALGAPPSNRDAVRTRGHESIVRGMRKHGVDRLVSLSVMGVGDSQTAMPLYINWLVVPLWLRLVFQDHVGQEAVIRSSDRSWTIVRPPFLTDGAATETYAHGFPANRPPPSMQISRADVASFLLGQLNGTAYLQQTVGISGGAR